jgi:hypothetical protein
MEHCAHGRGRSHPRGWGNNVLPLHLQHPMPTFVVWLQARMHVLVATSATIDEDHVQLLCLLSWIMYTYSNMWAYGNHFRVDLETRGLHTWHTMLELDAYLIKQVKAQCEIKIE